MKNKFDSTTLFAAQVKNHGEVLSGLLALAPNSSIESDQLARSIVSTAMLASSASLLEMPEWENLLVRFGCLLELYQNKDLTWDERLSQVTSEIIDQQETFASQLAAAPRTEHSLQGLTAVTQEVETLFALADTVEAVQEPAPPAPQPALRGIPAAADPAQTGVPQATAPQPNLAVRSDNPLSHSMTCLRDRVIRMVQNWNAKPMDFATGRFDELRNDLLMINYHAQAMEQIVRIKTRDDSTPSMAPFSDINDTILDFARVMCSGTHRRIDVRFAGDQKQIDTRLLLPTINVLQCMIGDIFDRCDDEYLHIEIATRDVHGRLLLTLRDNGSNFITDSRLDPDEFLAFYPRLRSASKILSRHQCLLWVEPDDNRDARFAFTIPASMECSEFAVWGDDKAFAVHATQLDCVLQANNTKVLNDTRGEYIELGDNRVSLVRLGQLYRDAPTEGDTIVIIGSLEKRIGFYANGSEYLARGVWQPDGISAWRESKSGVVRVDEARLPLVEAEGLIQEYLAIMNAGGDIAVSGNDSQNTTAPTAGNAPGGKNATDVLILERSEALRTELHDILSGENVSTVMFDTLENAMGWLRESSPTVIISEFRVPSMAARVFVDEMQRSGKNIPVLVTTTHQGENADLLVKKLGAASYISKPLDIDQVVSTMSRFVHNRPMVT